MRKTNTLPILYSLRNCPYAIRARIAIFKAKQKVVLRDVVLSNKPPEMIIASPKATVPILILPNGNVIDESLSVMLWALRKTDPDDLMHKYQTNSQSKMLIIINEFDCYFKSALEQYKCAKRYREDNIEEHREQCEKHIKKLELHLSKHLFIMSNKESLVDIAVLPFIRQFARVERQWYLQSPYPKVRRWLNNYLQSSMFTKVMTKYPVWLNNSKDIFFSEPDDN